MMQTVEKEKRKRAVNFTPREQNLLFSIAVKYKKTIENKETNAVSNSEKNEAWTRITNEFNAASQDFNKRSIDQLKRLYENRRAIIKKKKAEVRQEYLKTGGGPPTQNFGGEDDQLVLATLDPLIVEGDCNKHDCDNINFIGNKKPKENLRNIEYILEYEPNEGSDQHEEPTKESTEQLQNIQPIEDWKKYTISSLRKPLNPVLERIPLNPVENQSVKASEEPKRKIVKRGSSRRRPTAPLVRTLASSSLQQKYEELADKKNILADHAIKKIENERFFAEEEHRLKIRSLELDIELKSKKLANFSKCQCPT